MNDIDLTKILKDCPKGWKFYTTVWGDVEFDYLIEGSDYPIHIKTRNRNVSYTIRNSGRLSSAIDAECIIFPSKDQRDWRQFTAPWYKKERFDPKTLKAFDMVLVKMKEGKIWYADIISVSANENKLDYCTITIGDADYDWVIPYNDDTKHLVGTDDEAPEFYRYWEE